MVYSRIEQIVEDVSHRTVWGICMDVMELADIKARATSRIERIDSALITIEEHVKKHHPGPLPVFPSEEEE